MIWFDIDKLEEKLGNNELSDAECFKYVLGFAIAFMLSGFAGSDSQDDMSRMIAGVSALAITTWGVSTVFKVNSSGDGREFFKRLFAIGWVTGIRILVFVSVSMVPFIFGFAFVAIAGNIETPSERFATSIPAIVIGNIVYFLFFLELIQSFRRVSRRGSFLNARVDYSKDWFRTKFLAVIHRKSDNKMSAVKK